jgi:hypothetical protein
VLYYSPVVKIDQERPGISDKSASLYK